MTRARLLAVVWAACACEPAFACVDAVEAGALELAGDGAGATMQGYCEEYTLGVEVDALVVRETSIRRLSLPCVCGVKRSVEISDNPELLDLHGLEHLRAIGGGIVVARNPKLASLAGLPPGAQLGVTADDHSILIEDNDALLDLAGLPRAGTELPGDLEIVGNDRLTSLDALPPDLTRVRGLRIAHNPALVSLAGLPPDLADVGAGGLVVAANDRLRDLEGLPPNLTHVGGSVAIRDNDELERLAGFPAALTAIGGGLEIADNPALRDLSGLPEGLRIAGALELRALDGLVDLAGLPARLQLGVDPDTRDSLRIDANAGLLDLAGLPADITTLAGSVRLRGNHELIDLSGLFEHLERIEGALEIAGDHALVDLTGLPPGLRLGADPQGTSLLVADNAGLERLTGFPAGLDVLPGGLTVLLNRRLRDLSGLEPLRRVGGDLLIGRRRPHDDAACAAPDDPGGNGGLQTLTGLSALEHVGGTLAIACHPGLTALDAFAALHTVDGSLLLRDNPALADITGLGGSAGALTRVGGVFELRCSPLLDLEEAVDVLAHVTDPVPATLDLTCP
ncbi:hypothetical protein [Nannocystis pusilla]|uniref:Receptor L-domain domain-containing protein n=1 Tax=Nannocystis pusilla TaxID=889268 RepID=A0ABS7TWQ1_9BACT|nr:hypothetical protein [Nannocystis pusilla]MBZ5712586.1 hypothetical protein [Nannocystis pusilla]